VDSGGEDAAEELHQQTCQYKRFRHENLSLSALRRDKHRSPSGLFLILLSGIDLFKQPEKHTSGAKALVNFVAIAARL
jgi:hypothetical protein